MSNSRSSSQPVPHSGEKTASDEKTQPGESRLPKHLLRLDAQGEWAVWRSVALRSAGFPAHLVMRLTFSECAAAADRLLAARAAGARIREQALDEIRAQLDELSSAAGDQHTQKRRTLLRALGSLKKGKISSKLDSVLCRATLDKIMQAKTRLEAAQESYQRSFRETMVRQSQQLFEIASTDLFREAVLWQNRGAFKTAVEKLVESDPQTAPRNSRRRQWEALVASYVQRYAVKNDTIGFFGPIAWGQFVESGSSIETTLTSRLLAERKVFFESWCIQQIAAALPWKEIRAWLCPQRLPLVQVRDGQLLTPMAEPVSLDAIEKTLLCACDGTRTAAEIARQMLKDPHLKLADPEDVYRLLEGFRDRKVIQWELLVPTHPAAVDLLRQQIEAIEDAALRRVCLAPLDEMEDSRRAVAAAAGDVAKLDRALAALEDTFTRQTGVASSRRSGQTYGGRTLVYEDCRRDLRFELGPGLLEEISKPLSLILMSARWMTDQVAQAFREITREVYLEMAPDGRSPVPILALWQRMEHVLPVSENVQRLILPPLARLQQKWRQIFNLPVDERRLHLRSEELRERVEKSFDHGSVEPGWPSARYHSPDIMISAASLEALRQGDYELVLSEMHAGTNTLNSWVFLALHPNLKDIFRALDEDFDEPHLVLTMSHDMPSDAPILTRTGGVYIPSADYIVPPLDHITDIPASQVLPATELVVQATEDGLFVQTYDGRLRFDSAESLGSFISYSLASRFDLLEEMSHCPRITIDRMVVARESWRFMTEELVFAHLQAEDQQFLSARQWADDYDLPRFVFAQVTAERKPIYVDFHSPIYVANLAKIVRAAERAGHQSPTVKITEMLPAPDGLWLGDAEDRRFTSEFRIVVTDRFGNS